MPRSGGAPTTSTGCCCGGEGGGLTLRSFLQAWEGEGDFRASTLRTAWIALAVSACFLSAAAVGNARGDADRMSPEASAAAAAVFTSYLWLLLSALLRAPAALRAWLLLRAPCVALTAACAALPLSHCMSGWIRRGTGQAGRRFWVAAAAVVILFGTGGFHVGNVFYHVNMLRADFLFPHQLCNYVGY